MDPETKIRSLVKVWDCPHVLKYFPRDLPPPWGQGYDDEWPPGEDPCWHALAAPLAEDLEAGTVMWRDAKEAHKRIEWRIRWLHQAATWLELMGYLVIEKEGRMYLTDEGRAWLAGREWEKTAPDRRPLILGEAPGRFGNGKPPFSGSSGLILAKLLGTNESGLRCLFRLQNVFDRWPGLGANGGSAFPLQEARARLRGIKFEGTLVVAGRRVAAALRAGTPPFFEWIDLRGAKAAIIPHPSGVNQWWDDEENKARGREFLKEVAYGEGS